MEFSSLRKTPLNVSGFSRDSIEKSSYSEIFGYSNNLKIHKTGKEIKEALEKLKSKGETEKTALYEKMADILAKCDETPNEKMSEYVADGFYSKLNTIPKLFGYDKCCYPVEDVNTTISFNEKPEEEKEKVALRDKYNNAAREYVRKCVDILKLETTINNLSDKSKYELTVNQAALLGF